MKARTAIMLGALIAADAVAFGAFGAHVLRSHLSPESMAIFETGVRYQMYHAFALLITSGLISRGSVAASRAAVAFTVGIVLFSGSLYIMALTGSTWPGPITPLGGAAFLVGWGFLVCAGWQQT